MQVFTLENVQWLLNTVSAQTTPSKELFPTIFNYYTCILNQEQLFVTLQILFQLHYILRLFGVVVQLLLLLL